MIFSGSSDFDDIKFLCSFLDKNTVFVISDKLRLEVDGALFTTLDEIAEKLFLLNNEDVTKEKITAFKKTRKTPSLKCKISKSLISVLNYIGIVKSMLAKGSLENKKYVEEMTQLIGIENFDPYFYLIEIRAGLVTDIENVEGTEKMYSEKVMMDKEYTICSGLREYYTKDELCNKTFLFVSNGKKVKFKGIESEGMILAAKDDNRTEAIAVACGAGTKIEIEGSIPIFKDLVPAKVDLKKPFFRSVLERYSIVDGFLSYSNKRVVCGGEYVKTKILNGTVG